ncbi:sigma 54-interacting transcriptional regulator [Xanthobacter autotrophicus DSM 431]|uniref:sigma 54-interacting transcriptional regulator n=1 Tax=Xanthobacter nonsaccharivorans TaxID=3119912 RepID=UPI00372C0B85
MTVPTELQSFHVVLRDTASLGREAFEAFIGSRPFRAFADLLPSPLLIVDPDELVVFTNRSAERLAGSAGLPARLPLTSFLQQSSLDMDDFLAATERGQSQGSVRARGSGRMYQALRRVLSVDADTRGFLLYWLNDPESWDRTKRGAQSRTVGRAEMEGTSELSFPPDLKNQITRAQRAYARQFRILLLGESGVGKTAVAKHIHTTGGAAGRPFIHVNCGSIPETLFESEMFGYERGAFTGALQAGKRGYIESAGGGTLFLDEVGEIPLASQAKLLKFLEDGTIQSVGSAVSKRVDTHVVAATNRDLHTMMQEGGFRRDLYFRLATFPVHIPPLRAREDKEAILDALVVRANRMRGRPLALSPACRARILAHDFPGNLRELRSIVEYLDIVAEELAEPCHLPESLAAPAALASDVAAGVDELFEASEAGTLRDLTRAFEDQVIQRALERYGSKREAARRLGVDIATLVRKTTRPKA